MNRCKWKNLETNPIYIEYHDKEWGVVSRDDRHLFEMLILESFHCGLSWLIILKKRGFKFMGTVTTYSYLEAIGVMNNHASECFRYHQR